MSQLLDMVTVMQTQVYIAVLFCALYLVVWMYKYIGQNVEGKNIHISDNSDYKIVLKVIKLLFIPLLSTFSTVKSSGYLLRYNKLLQT
jgi:hypothetical protein